ncbi:MAG: hypothetical protein WBB47_17390 [Paenisporosarcina sp.]
MKHRISMPIKTSPIQFKDWLSSHRSVTLKSMDELTEEAGRLYPNADENPESSTKRFRY